MARLGRARPFSMYDRCRAALTGLGVAFLLTGALVVAVYAALEYVGLRRLPRGGSA
ncbi:hypothetical protein [Nonomuraea terrae]|uniref:hypothetical protein n=1 Tax=Nonomuraea terrae TaxID=2530383 RepID=UPI0014044745|nr:hypothetical protein [Nonomuraea terrae]